VLDKADRFIITRAANFAATIGIETEMYDAVMSNHNLEHCDNRGETLANMAAALKTDGHLFLAFPCEHSIDFPNRAGTLNYYDDTSHKDIPPKYDEIIKNLKKRNMKIIFAPKSYKPIFLYFIGLLNENKFMKDKAEERGTGEYYGFETIIWAKKYRDAPRSAWLRPHLLSTDLKTKNPALLAGFGNTKGD
jgi:SAM-dependent methyltransferase